ncbi:translation initiation factor IF-2 subunit alpha [Candidatus Woesearchaeota archaeon]|nr:translation initiation factor IF-2 subunit alpha [Candidatus Woesearchaeota archaeon]
MYYKKKGLPEERDIILCTVKKVLPHCVFVTLDEYEGQEGMIHISEVSPGRIRNIRDFVKEGKKIVCLILRIKQNQVDLSLRRVSTSMRRAKNETYKQEQKAEKILEILASKVGADLETLYKDFGEQLISEHGSIYKVFELVVEDRNRLQDFKIPKKYLTPLLEIIEERILPPEVSLHGTFTLQSESPDGVEVIRSTLLHAKEYAKEKNYRISIYYLSAPKYALEVKASDYKSAEKGLAEISEETVSFLRKYGGDGTFRRNEK